MDITEITDFFQIIGELPTNWKIVFIVAFFLIPKIIQTLGGGKIVQAAFKIIWDFIVEVVRRYQARKAKQAEDRGLTEAYTRTLVVESLTMFSARLKTIEEKIDFLLEKKRDPELEISLKKIRNLIEKRED